MKRALTGSNAARVAIAPSGASATISAAPNVPPAGRTDASKVAGPRGAAASAQTRPDAGRTPVGPLLFLTAGGVR